MRQTSGILSYLSPFSDQRTFDLAVLQKYHSNKGLTSSNDRVSKHSSPLNEVDPQALWCYMIDREIKGIDCDYTEQERCTLERLYCMMSTSTQSNRCLLGLKHFRFA